MEPVWASWTTCTSCHDIRPALYTPSLITPNQNYCLWSHKQQYKASVLSSFLLKYFSIFLENLLIFLKYFPMFVFPPGGWRTWWSPVRCPSCHSHDQKTATPPSQTTRTSSRTQSSSGPVSSANWAQTRCRSFRTSSRWGRNIKR